VKALSKGTGSAGGHAAGRSAMLGHDPAYVGRPTNMIDAAGDTINILLALGQLIYHIAGLLYDIIIQYVTAITSHPISTPVCGAPQLELQHCHSYIT
jgi:hypothetical protein